MGRKSHKKDRTDSEEVEVITVKVPVPIKDRFAAYCKDMGSTPSVELRRKLIEMLKEFDAEKNQ